MGYHLLRYIISIYHLANQHLDALILPSERLVYRQGLSSNWTKVGVILRDLSIAFELRPSVLTLSETMNF